MSVHVTSWVLRHSEERLGNRLVLLVLADKADDDGTNAWPSVATIAREARMTERQAQRCLRSLEENGSIIRQGRHRKGSQRHGTYVYDVVIKGDNMSPLDDRTVTTAPAKGDISSQRVADMSPEPSLEPSEVQPPELLPAAPEYDPVKGVRVDGHDLVWDALAAETNATDEIHASRMKRSVTSIRRQTIAWLAKEKPGAVERAQSDPEGFERALAETVRVVVGRMKRRSPDLTWGPEGIARNFGAHLSEASGGNVQSIVADVLRGAA